MKSIEYTAETGKINRFNLWEELEQIDKLDKTKPSHKIFSTKKGKRAIKALVDLEKNHNHSWAEELIQRAKKNPDALALFYRGTKISFKEMIENGYKVAQSLLALGIHEGDEIPCCLSNTPELVYIMIAANLLGAKLNLFGSHLDSEYLNDILDNCTSKVLLVSDDNYSDIESIISCRNYDNKVLISLADSLPKDPKKCDEYEPELDEYYYYPNMVNEFKEKDNLIISFDEFVKMGSNTQHLIKSIPNLDNEFLVTYTSGSTKIGHPSQIVHTNRSLIVSGRFHDSELSGNPELEGLRGLAHIHTESNTDVITCISDNLMQLWSVALEPEYDKEKALDYIMLNKPNYLNITTSFLVEVAKQYLIDKKFHDDGKGRKLPFLLAVFAVGEGLSKGEEKFINKFLRVSKAGSGVKIAGLSLPFTTVSVGGGDCEHGGIYYTLWKSLYEKLNYFKLSQREYGLMPEPFAQVSAFKKDKDGLYRECGYNELGLIAANSATTMQGYKNDKQKTQNLLIRDTEGRDWVSSNVLGYIDELGGVHVKGRFGSKLVFSNGLTIPSYVIDEIVCSDTKNILSCSTTQTEDQQVVINIEFQPEKKSSDVSIIKSIYERIVNRFSTEIANDVVFRVFDYENSFPLTGSGKRSIRAVEELGLKDVIYYDNINENLCKGNKNIKILERKKD